jgi:hypothetical protein
VPKAGPSAAELKEERKETMTKAAASKQSGKSGWQKFVSGVLDVIRPACAAVHTPVMKVLDAPSRRRVQKAASVEDLRIAAEKRMHAMCYGYLAGGADEEVALRRSVDCYKDVELRHAVLHGVGHGEVDPSTTILGHEAKLPFFVTSCAGFDAASFSCLRPWSFVSSPAAMACWRGRSRVGRRAIATMTPSPRHDSTQASACSTPTARSPRPRPPRSTACAWPCPS